MTTAIKKYVIACDIRLTAPMHISAIEKGAYNPDRQVLQRSPASKAQTGFIGTSLTRTAEIGELSKLRKIKMIAVKSGVGAEDDESVESPDSTWNRFDVPIVPIIPSSTIGGLLRRAAAEMLMDSMSQRDMMLTPDAYNTLTSGSATTSLLGASMQGMQIARMDPFLGNFGGTTFMVAAGTVISEGWPILKITESRHMTPTIGDTAPLLMEDIKDLTRVWQVVRKNDAQGMTDQERLIRIVGEQHLNDYMTEINDKQSKSKARQAEGEVGTKTDLRALNGIETVMSGLSFALRVGIKATTAAHLGLMILAMQKFIVKGRVGGKEARGFGQFICLNSRLLEIDPATGLVVSETPLFEEKSVGYKLFDNEVVTPAVSAAVDYIDACDPGLYTAFAEGNEKALQARFRTAENLN